jgi:hypothetical protein
MKSLILSMFGLMLAAFVSAQSIGPDVIASGGGYSEQPGVVSLSWTLGEPVIETFSNIPNDIILTQGFQQSHYNIVAIEEQVEPGFSLNAYPNPTSDQVTIEWKAPENSTVLIELYDMLGRKLVEKSLPAAASNVQIDMKKLAPATYVLKASANDGKMMKKFNIVKNQ